MNYENSKSISKTIITLTAVTLLAAMSAAAQIGQLGIYGSAPAAYRANVRYILLQDYPEYDGGLIYFLPVNGLSNFNFYYNPEGTGFLPTGTYKLTYLNGTLNTSYGDDIVYYSANSGHTNGVQVRAFYNPPSTPCGVHGVVKVYVPGGGGTTTPLENATIKVRPLGSSGDVVVQANANGYFSVYYENDNFGHFLRAIDHWEFFATGSRNGCSYSAYRDSTYIFWNPTNTTNPSLESYYVTDAEWDMGDIIIGTDVSGCTP